jgi:hypothetical protein
MKRKSYFVLAAALLLCLAGWTAYSQKSPSSKTSWEYLVIADPGYADNTSTSTKLTELGAERWELVGISDQLIGPGTQTTTRLFFKRAK